MESRPDQPIVVPFGGADHDWAALELGSWLANALGRGLRLLGAAEGDRDPSRLLANASVVLQQLTGVVADIRIAERSPAGLSEAVADASFLVVGLSARWREEGLGTVRTQLAERSSAPVLFVRRGSRPGVLAPSDDMTRFSWSYSGGSTMQDAAPVPTTDGPPANADERASDADERSRGDDERGGGGA